ncbi:hypothetical protein E2C01_082594 [Portunus trituberculatus]|uniref:Uncharacterized protein n=1 Tax=Portunus trituberculatus TaxID=210409 RepID=A0A5B7IV00_PORTR|nr:hypothetical protein [Portunus trituberculatus]
MNLSHALRRRSKSEGEIEMRSKEEISGTHHEAKDSRGIKAQGLSGVATLAEFISNARSGLISLAFLQGSLFCAPMRLQVVGLSEDKAD